MLTGVLREQTTKIGKSLILIILGIAIGYLYRSHQLASNVVTYTDVLIREKVSEDHFRIQPARMLPIDSKVCYSNVDWKQGEVLCLLKFEQMRGCKRIIAYDRYNCQKGELRAGN